MTEIFEAIADRLRKAVPCPVICEVEGDVSKRLQANVAKQKLAVLVAFNGTTPDKQAQGIFIGKTEVLVSVFEKPVVNRSKPDEPHLLEVASAVRDALTYFEPDGAASCLFYRRTSPISEMNSEIGDVITCDVVFDLKTN